ncbi:hypothetical protein ACFVXG_15600, partial [Kitasatospora sp. NPDC058162]
AAQTLDVTGRTTASTLDVTSNATVTGTLGVTGKTTASTLDVTSNATVTGTLGVTGITASGLIQADGGVTVPANQTLTVNGPLALTGSMSLLVTFGVKGGQREFTAGTSGLVVGVADVADTGGRGTVEVKSGSTSLATAFGEHKGSATVVARVKKDQRFTVILDWWDGNNSKVSCRFYWLPFGSGTATALDVPGQGDEKSGDSQNSPTDSSPDA